jgi:hypothetical protein
MNMNISKERYHMQKYLESLMCTLAFELFIVNGPSELKAILDDRRWLAQTSSISPFVPHVVKITLCRITPLHLSAHTTLNCLHVTP